jgi:hypothetical protein
MGFLTPLMLFGVLAAGIPVAIHLFFRSRYRTVPWAAMKFLLTSVEQTSRRMKFQELILLLLRMALLAALAFAFARPVSLMTRGAGRGEAVDAVFVIDTSYSMGAQDGAKTRFERTKDEAIKIIDELPAHSTVQIVTCAGATKNDLGPRSPANLDQARQIIQDLELTSLGTDLSVGVAKGHEILNRGATANKELYVFSDMQKAGFEQEADKLKTVLTEIKKKAVVHFVRGGTRTPKNVAIVGIAPQSGVPRPGTRDFAVLVRNNGTDAIENVKLSLTIDGDEKEKQSVTEIKKIPGGDTYAATLTGKLEKPGLRVLTAKIIHDELPGDNRFDQVIQVRDQVNILVIDGNYSERDPSQSSSYFLMHALLPVKDADRAKYHLQPRVRSARLASPTDLIKQDICVLVNCSLQSRPGSRAEVLPTDFVEALGPFVRKGHGLIVYGGENVQPDAYNKILGKKLELLPLPLKALAKAANNKPFMVDRDSFNTPSYRNFKEDEYYKDFTKVEVWQAHEMDESVVKEKEKLDAQPAENETAKKQDNPVSVLLRLSNGKPLVASKKVDAGEVVFVGTAANFDLDEKTQNPTWTNWPLLLGIYVPFVNVTTSHLLQGQSQTYNLKAGEVLHWYPSDRFDNVFELFHPDDKSERLNPPEKIDQRYVVTAPDLPRAGIYRMTSIPRGSEGSQTTLEAIKNGTPIAVVPDLKESENLTTLSAKDINDRIGFDAIHLVAGEEGVSTGSDRLNREWTTWSLMTVLVLLLITVAFAWWCSKAF